jgi:hypothetical protein
MESYFIRVFSIDEAYLFNVHTLWSCIYFTLSHSHVRLYSTQTFFCLSRWSRYLRRKFAMARLRAQIPSVA